MDPFRTHRSLNNASKVKVINGSLSSPRSNRSLVSSRDTRDVKEKSQSQLWPMNNHVVNGFKVASSSCSASSHNNSINTFGLASGTTAHHGFVGNTSFYSHSTGHCRIPFHRNVDLEEAMDIDHQEYAETPGMPANQSKVHTTSYSRGNNAATWKVLNTRKLNLPSTSPKETTQPENASSNSSKDVNSSSPDVNVHVSTKPPSKLPLKKKPIHIVLHVGDVMIGHLRAKASAPIKIYAEKLFLEIEFQDSSVLSIRLPCTELSQCMACFEPHKPVIVLTLTKQGVKLINDKKKNIILDADQKDESMEKIVLYLNHIKNGVPQSIREDLKKLFQRRVSGNVKWHEMSSSEITKVLNADLESTKDKRECNSSENTTIVTTDTTYTSDPDRPSTSSEPTSGRKILTPKKSRNVTRKALFEAETTPSSTAQLNEETTMTKTNSETTTIDSKLDEIITRSRRRKAEAEAADASSPPKTSTTSSAIENKEMNKDEKCCEDIPRERDILQHHSKMESHISLLGKHSEEQRNTLEHHQKLLTLERAERNRNFERIQELQSTQRENQLRLMEKNESISLLEREVENQKVTVRQLQQDLALERESTSLMRNIQSDLAQTRRELEEEKAVHSIRDKQLQDKQAELEEMRRMCSEEGNSRRLLEEELQRTRNSCVQHMDELENQRLFRQTQEHELQGREERLQASEQRWRDEHAERRSLEEQLRSLRMENEELRRSRDANEEELVQERCRRREQSESFVQERQTYEQRLRESVNSMAVKERRIQELQAAMNNSQSVLDEQRRIEPRDWIIRREEVTYTDESLGNGAWGTVKVGVFRRCKVAIKQIHELILSPHNRRLFEREMSIAARCRHPCLLQFIGATNDDGIPLFITELLDADLRAVLSQRSLHQEEIIEIALDVARALNYLHLNRPYPIIHRDISSSNVLLWKRDSCWRAKLSDYGAANFMRQYMTVNPGAGIYAAPEAYTSQQSPKVDIYSFGLLLCELCIRELPVPQQTQEQISLVTNGMLRELIMRCIRVDPETRPIMAEIITLLERQQANLLEHGVVSVNGRSAAL